MGSIVESPEFDVVQALAQHGVNSSNSKGGSDLVLSQLSSLYPKQTISSSADTETWCKGLWSLNQRAAKPKLVFQPTSAKEVAIVVLLCRQANLKFSVKSGGHAAMKGASSVDEGVAIDLRNLNSLEYNEDKSIAKIGAGNKWEPVFEELRTHGLAVAGGRAGDVGVGGYSLGGGISFFASARGWACDNIRNYQLVTANGEILDVNYKSYPDLFWALRGGGTNFGIVTRFDYETFPQGDVFAGSGLYAFEHKDTVVKAFTSAAHSADPKLATWLSVAFHEGHKLFSCFTMFADPTPDFAHMKAYGDIPALHETRKVRSMASIVHEIAEVQATDHHQNYWNHTFKFDPEFISWLVDMYFEVMGPHAGKYESKQASVIVMQYITKEACRHMQREGGNCLPLNEDDAPYVNFLIPTAWMHEKDNDFVMGIVRKIMNSAVDEAKKRGLFVDFVYMNYASMYQDVLKGYGKENYNRLKEVAAKYDPEGVFQTLMPGYFKFGGAPA